MSQRFGAGALAVWLVLGGAWASAAEPAQAFLDALRERGYFDTAIEYMDAIKTDPTVPVKFKETLPYERGLTLVAGARAVRDPALREKQLDEAQKQLQSFVEANPAHLLGLAARGQLGNIMVERARSRMRKAEKAAPAEKTTLHAEARGLYEEALKAFAEGVSALAERLKAYPASIDQKKDAKRYEEREQYRKDYLQSQLLAAATKEEMTETYPKGDKAATTLLEGAAKEYGDIYANYRTRLAGLYARMYQGRCLQKLGKHKEALGFFTELLSNPDEPAPFRTLRVKVTDVACDSWMAEKLYLEILDGSKTKSAMQLLQSARGSEDRDPDFLSIRLKTVDAAIKYIEELKAKNPKDPLIAKLLKDGGTLVRYGAKLSGDLQPEFQKRLGMFGSAGPAAGDKPDPKTFTDARKAGKEAIDVMQQSGLVIKQVSARLPTVKDPAERAEMQKQVDDATKEAADAKLDAQKYLKLALGMVQPDTDLTELNLVRYLLSYLAYTDENYFDAVVMGEFLAYRYPDAQGARQCAKIAMASYIKLYGENKEADKDFETRKIVSICDYIVSKWPDQPEAQDALNTLIPFMIKERKLKEAQDYLAKIPNDSPHRGSAELKTGQALWASYLESSSEIRKWEADPSSKPENIDLAARKAELDVLKTNAKTTLVNGVARMQQSGEVTQVLVAAMLSLSQIYVDTAEPAKAITTLEDAKVGPLPLVRAGHETTSTKGFAEEVFKTALRSYISSLAGAGASGSELVEKAKLVMTDLGKHVGADADGQKRLIGIYVSLAKDLQKQMELSDDASKVALGKGFEAFLDQLASAPNTDFKILNWIAETYRGMGDAFGAAKAAQEPAKTYLTKAITSFQKLRGMAEKDPNSFPKGFATVLRLNVARVHKSKYEYVEAMKIYEEILKENNLLLPVQVEAARVYQDWGALNAPDQYLRAMFGGDAKLTDAKTKVQKPVIWGWGQTAKMTSTDPKFRDTFFEARYNLALCRYNYAVAQKDAAMRSKTFGQAKTDIVVTFGFYQDLGGDKWRPSYDALLKNVQKALGEPALGLKALEAALPPSNTAPANAAPGGTAQPAAPAKTAPATASTAK